MKALLIVLMIILAAGPAYSEQVIIEEMINGNISYMSNISVAYKLFNPSDKGASFNFYFPGRWPENFESSSYRFGEKRIYLSPGETLEETFNFSFPSTQSIGLWKGLEVPHPVGLSMDPGINVDFTRKGRLRIEIEGFKKVVCQGCTLKGRELTINQKANRALGLNIQIKLSPPLRAGLFYSIMVLGLIAFMFKKRKETLK